MRVRIRTRACAYVYEVIRVAIARADGGAVESRLQEARHFRTRPPPVIAGGRGRPFLMQGSARHAHFMMII